MFLPTLFAAALAAPAAPHLHEAPGTEPGVTVLFDGTDLSAWTKYPQGKIPGSWRAEGDGSLHFLGKAGGGRGDLMTKDAFADFDLRFEFKVAPGANSGVIYGVKPDPKAPAYRTGPEYQVLDDERHPDGRNVKNRVASLYALRESKTAGAAKPVKPVGEWNKGRIVKDGDVLRHYLNGAKVVEIEIGSEDWDAAVADSKFAGWENFAGLLERGEAGHIVLQDHGDEVWYRNVTVRAPGGAAPGERPGEGAAATKARPRQEIAPAAVRAKRVDAEAPDDAEMPDDAPPAAVTGRDLVNGSDWAAFLGGTPAAAGGAADGDAGGDWAAFLGRGSAQAGDDAGGDWAAFLRRESGPAQATPRTSPANPPVGGVRGAEPVGGAGG